MSLKAVTNFSFSIQTKMDTKRRRTIMVSSMGIEMNDNFIFSLLPPEINQELRDYMDIFDFVSFLI